MDGHTDDVGGDDIEVMKLVDKGISLAEQGEIAAAIQQFQNVVEKHPQRAVAHEMLAQCLMEDSQIEEACNAATTAVSLRPDWPEGLLTLGRALRNAGDLAAAETTLSLALDLQQHKPALHDGDLFEDIVNELAEVKALRSTQMGHVIGLPGLVIHTANNNALTVPTAKGNEDSTASSSDQQQEQRQEEEQEALGPGARVWESGVLLAQLCVSQHKKHGVFSDVSVLELGTGTGILGICLALLGANVVATDQHQMLPLCEVNTAANAGRIAAAGGSFDVEELEWSDAPLLTDFFKENDYFDWVVGSDLVYTADKVPHLLAVIAAAVNTRTKDEEPVKVVIAHKMRHEEVDKALIKGLLEVCSSKISVVAADKDKRVVVLANEAAKAALGL